MCSPCGPMVCYKYEDCGPPKGKPSEGASGAEGGGAHKKDEKENQLKRIKSRELRGGVMYYSCHCIKRNGLQHDCRRTGCGGEPACLVLPDPLCAPSQLARARGLADPAPLAPHWQAQSGGGGGASSASAAGGGSGKRFIVCELKGIVPDVSSDKGGNCCKCSAQPVSMQSSGAGACICTPIMVANQQPVNQVANRQSKCCPCSAGGGGSAKPVPVQTFCTPINVANQQPINQSKCPCSTGGGGGSAKSVPMQTSGVGACVFTPINMVANQQTVKCCPCSTGGGGSSTDNPFSMFVFDEETLEKIFQSFDDSEVAKETGGGGLGKKAKKPAPKSEPCTRPGCVHWQPPPPCVWDLPCKADCFEAHPGIQPGRNTYMSGGMIEGGAGGGGGPGRRLVMLSPANCQ